jgi:hypothetical protein
MVTNSSGNQSFMQPMNVFFGHGWFFGCLGIPIFSFLLVSG